MERENELLEIAENIYSQLWRIANILQIVGWIFIIYVLFNITSSWL